MLILTRVVVLIQVSEITYHYAPLASVPLPWIAGSRYTPCCLLTQILSTTTLNSKFQWDKNKFNQFSAIKNNQVHCNSKIQCSQHNFIGCYCKSGIRKLTSKYFQVLKNNPGISIWVLAPDGKWRPHEEKKNSVDLSQIKSKTSKLLLQYGLSYEAKWSKSWVIMVTVVMQAKVDIKGTTAFYCHAALVLYKLEN